MAGGHLQEVRPQGGFLTRSLGLLNHFLLEPWLSFLCPKYSEIVADRLAQLVEYQTTVREVVGSNPGRTNTHGL